MNADPVGIQEIAQRLGVKRQTASQWRQRKLLPEPDWTRSGVALWEWETIRAWADVTGRLKADPISVAPSR